MSKYPEWICLDCGRKYGHAIPGQVFTAHDGTCGWCGQYSAVTQPRDYGWPRHRQAIEQYGNEVKRAISRRKPALRRRKS